MIIDEMTKTQLGIYQEKNRLAQKKIQILANLESFGGTLSAFDTAHFI